MKVKKAVIAAAGLGTRVLPATKAVPKEMLPIVDKPAIQYIAEECAAAGINEILVVTSRGKQSIEDHFDRSPELESKLKQGNRDKLLNEMIKISEIADFTFVRQPFQTGLGAAVLCAEKFVGNEPFAVLYGDDVIVGDEPAIGQLGRAYEKYGKSVVGIKKVPHSDICKYNSLEISPLENDIYSVTDMIEKPSEGEEFSNFSILGRCILEPAIFDILRNIPKGRGGELQLTDAMREMAVNSGMIGVDFVGKRFDMGDKLSIIKAAVEVGLMREDMHDELADYIRKTAEKLRSAIDE